LGTGGGFEHWDARDRPVFPGFPGSSGMSWGPMGIGRWARAVRAPGRPGRPGPPSVPRLPRLLGEVLGALGGMGGSGAQCPRLPRGAWEAWEHWEVWEVPMPSVQYFPGEPGKPGNTGRYGGWGWYSFTHANPVLGVEDGRVGHGAAGAQPKGSGVRSASALVAPCIWTVPPRAARLGVRRLRHSATHLFLPRGPLYNRARRGQVQLPAGPRRMHSALELLGCTGARVGGRGERCKACGEPCRLATSGTCRSG
jgi:hypothetical protein